jgi:hypothetical protein
MTTVVVDDMVSDRITTFAVNDENRAFVKKHWDQSDKILAGLQQLSLFENRSRWCDLEPLHFRVLLVQNLDLYARLSETEVENPENATVKSLTFLLTALIYCVEQRSMMDVRFLTVTRINALDVAYEVSARFEAEMGFPGPRKAAPRLTVIVDNTKARSA